MHLSPGAENKRSGGSSASYKSDESFTLFVPNQALFCLTWTPWHVRLPPFGPTRSPLPPPPPKPECSTYLKLFFANKPVATMAKMLIKPVTGDLMHAALENLSATSSPGIDGFTGEIYKTFTLHFVPLMLKIYQQLLDSPSIPESCLCRAGRPGFNGSQRRSKEH